ncbi:MAG: NADH-quinone oxidoreductase subunit F, partial [Desulfobacteraceae bacterium]
MSRVDIKKHFAPIQREAARQTEEKKTDGIPTIYIVMSTCGLASGAAETKQAFEEALSLKSIEARIVPVGCLGHCYAEPLVVIDHPTSGLPPICYHQVSAARAQVLVRSYLEKGDPVFKYVLVATEENDLIPALMDFPRFNLEQRLVMEQCGRIDPNDIYQYVAEGGYGGLVKALGSDS